MGFMILTVLLSCDIMQIIPSLDKKFITVIEVQYQKLGTDQFLDQCSDISGSVMALFIVQ